MVIVEKKNPKFVAYLYNVADGKEFTRKYPFNFDANEDMSESEIRSYVASKWPNLVIRDIEEA
jgi:hypothetical protein